MTTLTGSRLGGRYVLTERLAFGGMGEVWRGTDDVLGRTVAVKILRPELADDNAFRRRFRAEARTAGGLSHPGIAAVYDYGEGPAVAAGEAAPDGASGASDKSVSYLVMELVPGEALSTTISREGALNIDRALDLVAQTARALHAAHLRGVVHRDVKPANLMVTPDGRVKVTDFGIARPKDHEPLTMTGQVMGTAHYLAPELARGQSASPLSDVYALGVVTYECLAGHRPFDGENQVAVATAHLSQQPPPLPTTVDPRARRLVAAAMTKDPTRRIQGADAFATALEGLRATLSASRSSAATRLVPPSSGAGKPGPLSGPSTDATVVSPEIAAGGAGARAVPTSTPTTPPARPGVPPATGLTPMGKIRPPGAPGTSPVSFAPASPSGPIVRDTSDQTVGIGPADGGIGAPTMGFNSALISGPKPGQGVPGAGKKPPTGGTRSLWGQRLPVMIAVGSMILLLGGVLIIAQVWGKHVPDGTTNPGPTVSTSVKTSERPTDKSPEPRDTDEDDRSNQPSLPRNEYPTANTRPTSFNSPTQEPTGAEPEPTDAEPEPTTSSPAPTTPEPDQPPVDPPPSTPPISTPPQNPGPTDDGVQ
ncbi:MAG: eukaryotic-like serine/threonine-protein kinase [Actinomycetota bacterium]|nr:eukaryotic-like serine/threonine-protein kinase [Actinomycetota bacterium]